MLSRRARRGESRRRRHRIEDQDRREYRLLAPDRDISERSRRHCRTPVEHVSRRVGLVRVRGGSRGTAGHQKRRTRFERATNRQRPSSAKLGLQGAGWLVNQSGSTGCGVTVTAGATVGTISGSSLDIIVFVAHLELSQLELEALA